MSNPVLNLSLSHPLPRPLYLNSHSILLPAFVLTDEQHMLLCPKDVREGKVIDRYLAPAISRFAIDIQTEEKCEPTLDEAEKELRREIVNLLHDFSRIVRRKKSHMGKRFHC